MQALFDYGPRYARVTGLEGIDFRVPDDPAVFFVTERLEGDATTDFGAPGKSPSSDARPVGDADLERFQLLLKACFQAFVSAIETATGKELQRGPRGGGRELEKIVEHVVDAEHGYLSSMGWKTATGVGKGVMEKISQIRQAALEGLANSAQGALAERGPRGGIRWTARYFVRRTAWHVLDHAWEIEDRIRQ